MAVCSSCLAMYDKWKTVEGALEAARSCVASGNVNGARQEYNFAIHTLEAKGGCSSCIRELIREKDFNT